MNKALDLVKDLIGAIQIREAHYHSGLNYQVDIDDVDNARQALVEALADGQDAPASEGKWVMSQVVDVVLVTEQDGSTTPWYLAPNGIVHKGAPEGSKWRKAKEGEK